MLGLLHAMLHLPSLQALLVRGIPVSCMCKSFSFIAHGGVAGECLVAIILRTSEPRAFFLLLTPFDLCIVVSFCSYSCSVEHSGLVVVVFLDSSSRATDNKVPTARRYVFQTPQFPHHRCRRHGVLGRWLLWFRDPHPKHR